MNVSRGYIQLHGPPLQIGPLAVGLVGTFASPYLVFDVNNEPTTAGDLDIDDRIVAGDLAANPIVAVGVFDRKTDGAELVEKQPEAESALGVRAEAAQVVVEQPGQHHAVPNLLAGEVH